MPSAGSPAAAKEPANTAFFERPRQIKTNARSAPGTRSILDFPQLFMEEGDICCDTGARPGMASLQGAIQYFYGGFRWGLTDDGETNEWHESFFGGVLVGWLEVKV